MPEYYVLTNNHMLNEAIASFLLFVYFLYSIRTIYELKSIIANTLLLFRTSIQFKILSFRDKSSDEITSDSDDGQ